MYDIHEEYTRLNSYYAFERGNGIWQSDKAPKRNDGEYLPEERDNEYFANKYAEIFCRIFSEIEHGHIQFSSREEENKEWQAACNAWYRYRDRAEMYHAKKYHTEEQTAERYKAKWCRYPDWYKPSA